LQVVDEGMDFLEVFRAVIQQTLTQKRDVVVIGEMDNYFFSVHTAP